MFLIGQYKKCTYNFLLIQAQNKINVTQDKLSEKLLICFLKLGLWQN